MAISQIVTNSIATGAVSAGDLADGSVTAAKLAAGVGGKVLQVVQTFSTGGAIQTSSGSLVSSGVDISITPSSSSSKVLVMCSFTATSTDSNITGGTQTTIYRGATNLLTGANYPGRLTYCSTATYIHQLANISVLDSPATTSSTTYTLYFRLVGGGNASIQRDWGGVHMIAMEIAA
jgi:hypothetical protein